MTKTLLAIVLMMILLGTVMNKVEVSKCFSYLIFFFSFPFLCLNNEKFVNFDGFGIIR